MANTTIKNCSLFVNGLKQAELTGLTYDQESGNELQIGDGDIVGVSQGVKTVIVTANSIIPYRGAPAARILEDAFDNNTSVQIGIGLLGGRIHKLDLFVTKFNIKSDSKNGTVTGDFTLIGGAGQKIG